MCPVSFPFLNFWTLSWLQIGLGKHGSLLLSLMTYLYWRAGSSFLFCCTVWTIRLKTEKYVPSSVSAPAFICCMKALNEHSKSYYFPLSITLSLYLTLSFPAHMPLKKAPFLWDGEMTKLGFPKCCVNFVPAALSSFHLPLLYLCDITHFDKNKINQNHYIYKTSKCNNILLEMSVI